MTLGRKRLISYTSSSAEEKKRRAGVCVLEFLKAAGTSGKQDRPREEQDPPVPVALQSPRHLSAVQCRNYSQTCTQIHDGWYLPSTLFHYSRPSEFSQKGELCRTQQVVMVMKHTLVCKSHTSLSNTVYIYNTMMAHCNGCSHLLLIPADSKSRPRHRCSC